MEDKILIAIITAASALSGVVISQFNTLIVSFLKRKNRKNVLLREKYELLMEHVLEALKFSTDAQQCKSMEELTTMSVNVPARKALNLSLIYFPELQNSCIDFQNSYIKFYGVLATSFKSGIPHNVGTQACAHNKDAFEATAFEMTMCRQVLDESMIKYSKKYTKA